jgi:hypothetical protein
MILLVQCSIHEAAIFVQGNNTLTKFYTFQVTKNETLTEKQTLHELGHGIKR